MSIIVKAARIICCNQQNVCRAMGRRQILHRFSRSEILISMGITGPALNSCKIKPERRPSSNSNAKSESPDCVAPIKRVFAGLKGVWLNQDTFRGGELETKRNINQTRRDFTNESRIITRRKQKIETELDQKSLPSAGHPLYP
jgi:hypothetical protein